MKPKWLIEEGVFPADSDVDSLTEALASCGIEYTCVKYKPSSEIRDYLKIYPGEDCVIFYGSLGLAKRLRKEAKWIPGVYYAAHTYDCQQYYAKLGKYLFNDEYVMLPYGELLRRKEFLYDTLGQDRAVFLRPSRGDKLFTGKRVYKEYFDKDVSLFGYGQISEEDLIVAATPKHVANEWRFVVVESSIVAGSQYKQNDQLDISGATPPQAAQDLAEVIAATYSTPDAAWIIDIGLSESGRYALMEVGCFSCAGLYACDRKAIVQAVSDSAFEEWSSYQC